MMLLLKLLEEMKRGCLAFRFQSYNRRREMHVPTSEEDFRSCLASPEVVSGRTQRKALGG